MTAYLSVVTFKAMNHPDRTFRFDAILQGQVPTLKLLILIILLTSKLSSRTGVY
uniref:Uncharacterized protein n=1 Tax=Arundo donax TaxID=35708 RepID=A0A0A9G2V9_ARUDO